MNKIKSFVVAHFELIFVAVILITTAIVNNLVPHKLGVLNFYFLPIILAGYYLGQRQAVLGALLAIITETGFVVVSKSDFYLSVSGHEVYIYLTLWGGFLILAGAVVGGLRERLNERVSHVFALNESLKERQTALMAANERLKDYTDNLEDKVRKRTEELEQAKISVDEMKLKLEHALYATMDSKVVNLMIEGKLRNEKHSVSVLFSDLVGFTTYSEQNPPESVIAELNRYLKDVEPVIMAYRGHIDKYMGDGIMCEFGAPTDYITHRTMAVVAGLKLQAKLDSLNYPWKMRVGIASGTAFTGLVGYKRQTYTAIGDVVNLAARLEQACTPGLLLIDKETYNAVAYFVNARRKTHLRQRAADHVQNEQRLDELYEAVELDPENPALHYEIANLLKELNDFDNAIEHLEKAVRLDPASQLFKIAYAEGDLLRKQASQLAIRGKFRRIEAYEVMGFKDPLLSPGKFPDSFHKKYGYVSALIAIPDDVVLPIEVLDDSVGHARVSATIAYAIASELGLAENDKRDILNAAFLAELGRESVPYNLLSGNENYGNADLDIIRQYPLETAKRVRSLGYDNENIIHMVKEVRERYDGKGYPYGLQGEKISLGARIIAVAGAYNVLVSPRLFRGPWDRNAALMEIRNETQGGSFDPRITATLEALLEHSV